MTVNRLADDLDPMRQAIADAQSFTEGMTQADFEQDRRTQQAVVMSLIVLGEAATKVMDQHSAFAAECWRRFKIEPPGVRIKTWTGFMPQVQGSPGIRSG